MERCPVLTNDQMQICPQVTLEEFSAAIMGQEKFSKMLTLKIIDIFIEDEAEGEAAPEEEAAAEAE